MVAVAVVARWWRRRQRSGSAATAAAAAWWMRRQLGGSMAGREAAALRRRELSFSLAVGVEARRQWRRRRQRWRQCGGSISRAAESARQRRGDGGQRGCCGVGSLRVAVAAPRRRWQQQRQLSGSRQQGGATRKVTLSITTNKGLIS